MEFHNYEKVTINRTFFRITLVVIKFKMEYKRNFKLLKIIYDKSLFLKKDEKF